LPILALKDLKVEYATGGGIVAAVDRGTLEVSKGQVIGLVGESGCGKTTLARAIIGVVSRNARIVDGENDFENRDLVRLTDAQKRDVLWREIAFIPQSAMNALDPVYRVSSRSAKCWWNAVDTRRPMSARASMSCFASWVSTRAGSGTIRISFPAACASASELRSRSRLTPSF